MYDNYKNTLATSIRSYIENNGPCNIDEIVRNIFITKKTVKEMVNLLVKNNQIVRNQNNTFE